MKSYRTYEMKNNVRNVRLSMKLSQKDLAVLCNTTQNTISAIETNKYEPSAYLAMLLCDTLKVPFEKLFFYEYEGIRAYADFNVNMPMSEYVAKLRHEIEWHRKFDEELERIATMDPFFE